MPFKDGTCCFIPVKGDQSGKVNAGSNSFQDQYTHGVLVSTALF